MKVELYLFNTDINIVALHESIKYQIRRHCVVERPYPYPYSEECVSLTIVKENKTKKLLFDGTNIDDATDYFFNLIISNLHNYVKVSFCDSDLTKMSLFLELL